MSPSVVQKFRGESAEAAAPLPAQTLRYKHDFAWLALILTISFFYLYTSLFSFSGIPYFGSLEDASDQSAFWTFASRLLHGQVFLKDFHQFTPPGTDLIYAAVFHWFGTGMRSINWTILCLGMLLVIVCYGLARSILRPSMAALAALLCLALLYGDRLDATHHWFSSLALLLAVFMVVPRRSWTRIAAAGILIALAAFCTQTRGVVGLLALSAGLIWERRISQISWRLVVSRLALLSGVTFGVWLLLSWRFIAQAGIATYWFEQIVYPPKDSVFPIGFLIPYFTLRPIPALFDHLTTYLLLLFVCPWVAILCARRRPETNQRSLTLFLLASLGVLQTLEIITMLNWNRMAAVAIPSVILVVWLIGQMGHARRAVIAACWFIVGATILVRPIGIRMLNSTFADLPTGVTLLQTNDTEEMQWLVRHTRPGDWFLEVATTRLYAPLALRNPMKAHLLGARSSTLPAWVADVIQELEQSRTHYVLWSPHSGIGRVDGVALRAEDHLDPLRIYIRSAYVQVAVFRNGDEIWERRN